MAQLGSLPAAVSSAQNPFIEMSQVVESSGRFSPRKLQWRDVEKALSLLLCVYYLVRALSEAGIYLWENGVSNW